MFAFSIVSAIKSPPLLRAAMPELSVLIDLMYWNRIICSDRFDVLEQFFRFGLVVGLVIYLVDHRCLIQCSSNMPLAVLLKSLDNV
jgi:hypothetical protein